MCVYICKYIYLYVLWHSSTKENGKFYFTSQNLMSFPSLCWVTFESTHRHGVGKHFFCKKKNISMINVYIISFENISICDSINMWKYLLRIRLKKEKSGNILVNIEKICHILKY